MGEAKTEAKIEKKGSLVLLTKAMIIDAQDLHREPLEVPEWNGFVYVRGMTGEERLEYDGGITTTRSRIQAGSSEGAQFDIDLHMHKMRIKVCAWCMVDDKGRRLFMDHEVQKLGEKSDVALQRVYVKALEKSGLAEEASKEAEDFSGPDQADAS